MPKTPKRKPVQREKKGHNLYALQSYQPEKFIRLVEKVLRQEYYLVR